MTFRNLFASQWYGMLLGLPLLLMSVESAAHQRAGAHPDGDTLLCRFECGIGGDAAHAQSQQVTSVLNLVNPTVVPLQVGIVLADGSGRPVDQMLAKLSPADIDAIDICQSFRKASVTAPQRGLAIVGLIGSKMPLSASVDRRVVVDLRIGDQTYSAREPGPGALPGTRAGSQPCAVVPSRRDALSLRAMFDRIKYVVPQPVGLAPVLVGNTADTDTADCDCFTLNCSCPDPADGNDCEDTSTGETGTTEAAGGPPYTVMCITSQTDDEPR